MGGGAGSCSDRQDLLPQLLELFTKVMHGFGILCTRILLFRQCTLGLGYPFAVFGGWRLKQDLRRVAKTGFGGIIIVSFA